MLHRDGGGAGPGLDGLGAPPRANLTEPGNRIVLGSSHPPAQYRSGDLEKALPIPICATRFRKGSKEDMTKVVLVQR